MKPVILISSGAYSDYMVIAVVHWLRDDVTPEQARDLYLGPGPHDKEAYAEIDGHKFAGWLNRNGYTEDIEAEELHVEEYGRISEWKREPFEQRVYDDIMSEEEEVSKSDTPTCAGMVTKST